MLVPETWGDSNHNFYQYEYFFNFDDKVYYAKANLDLTKQLLNEWNTIRKTNSPELSDLSILAGDLKEEYFYHKGMSINIEYITGFISNHLENIIGKKIQKISFIDPDNKYDLWVNYQSKNEHNPIHQHAGLYSFVWYLIIPDEIREEHETQKSYAPTRGLIEFSSSRSNLNMRFNPKTADAFIFDSKHNHQVYPFYSDNTRVSMAGNIHSITFEDGETITA